MLQRSRGRPGSAPPAGEAKRKYLRPDDEGSLSLGSLGSLSRADLTRLREDANEALAAARSRPPPPPPLEMRFFVDIPIANFALVLPDSRPAFQLSDWLRLDLVSTPALVATLASLRYDDSRLDLASAIAVGAWALRTVFSFRSAYGRYELLLQRTISDKLSIRDAAEVRRFAAREARAEQARRGACLLSWLRAPGRPPLSADALVGAAGAEHAQVDFAPALATLRRLGLVRAAGGAGTHSGELLEAAPDGERALSRHWQELL